MEPLQAKFEIVMSTFPRKEILKKGKNRNLSNTCRNCFLVKTAGQPYAYFQTFNLLYSNPANKQTIAGIDEIKKAVGLVVI